MNNTRLLIIADSPGDVDVVKETLTEQQDTYTFTGASSLEEGIRLLENQTFDAIILDLNLPDSAGLETLDAVIHHTPDTAILVTTGLTDEETGIKALQKGAQHYLIKEKSFNSILPALISHAIVQKDNQNRSSHLYRVLDAIRHINKLIVTEKQPHALIQKACKILTASKGYYHAWIALFDAEGNYMDSAQTGLNGDFKPLNKQLQKGIFPYCINKALSGKGMTIIEAPSEECSVCPLHGDYSKRSSYSMPLAHNGTVYGILTVSIPRVFVHNKDEQSLFQEAAGDLAYALHNIEEIRKKTAIEEALTQSEEKFRQIFNKINDAVYLYTVDADENPEPFLEVNDIACRMLGYSCDEFYKLTIKDINATVDTAQFSEVVDNLFSNKKTTFETTHRAKEGHTIPVEVNSHLFSFRGRKTILSVARDITIRKAAETEREALFSWLQKAGEIARVGGWQFDAKTLKGRWTAETARIHDLDPDEPTSVEIGLSFYSGNDRKLLEQAIDDAIKKHKPYDLELQMTTRKGNKKWVHTIGEPVVKNGEVVSVIGSFQDVTERRSMMESLRTAKEKAEEGEKLKTAFLKNLSHEIRTPLNVIMGFGSMLTDKALKQEDLERYVKIILSRGEDLTMLLNDLIDVAIIESGQLTITPGTCNINECLDELVRNYQSILNNKHRGKNIVLKTAKELQTKKAEIVTDGQRLKQVLSKLLDNAIKFTTEGHIEIGYRIAGDNELEIYLRDTGIGIPEDELENIFDPFRKVADERNPEKFYGGTGIGLNIVKKIVELLQGSVSVESTLNEGSTFYVRIPDGQEKPLTVTEESIIQSTTDTISWNDKTILIAEDDYASREYMSTILASTGATLLLARDGRECIEMFRKNAETDLILMDIKMPYMNGTNVMKKIKEEAPRVKIIAQTAFASADSRIQLLEEGFDEYLPKPISRERLLTTISKSFSIK